MTTVEIFRVLAEVAAGKCAVIDAAERFISEGEVTKPSEIDSRLCTATACVQAATYGLLAGVTPASEQAWKEAISVLVRVAVEFATAKGYCRLPQPLAADTAMAFRIASNPTS